MRRNFLQVARLRTRLTLRAALYPYLIWTAPRQKCLGIDVVDLTNEEEDPAPYFAKVTSALEIIARYQPKRLDRIRRDLRYILIFKQPGATYWDDLRACALSAQSVASRDTEVIALSIVHEATHARIHSRGIPYDPAHQARVERVCVNEEVSLVRLLANGSERAAQLLARLDTPWWTAEQMRERGIRRLEMNAPPWLVKLIMWLHPPP
jgi:hypothetical protein